MQADPAASWQRCIDYVKQRLSEQDFTTWFAPLTFLGVTDGTLTLGVPSRYFAGYFDQHYAAPLMGLVSQVWGESLKLQYKLPEERRGNESEAAAPAIELGSGNKGAGPSARKELPQLDSQLNPRYTFETFVEGGSNRLARSVGESIAERPGKSTFNPFFLYGPSGVGKTHLVNAIGVRIKQQDPTKRVLFVSAHLFKTQYTDSVIHNTQNDFLYFYQTIDVLIIDDIQEITTAKTQQAFFHIFNHLQQNNRQIIITCDRPPVLLEGMEDRMLTRFKWGMTAEMEKPDTRLRRDILISKIRRDGLTIPDEVVQYIAQNVESSVREIEGIVNSIMAYSVVDNCEIDLQLTQRIVARAVNLERKTLTVDDLISTVCQHYGVKRKEIISKSRKSTLVRARQLAMYLCHKYTETTYSQLGRLFAGRDHSTVLYACNQVGRRIAKERDYRREVEEIEATLK